jgi:hypothetical protein
MKTIGTSITTLFVSSLFACSATVITFDSYTPGPLASVGAATNNNFSGQDGWSKSSSSNAGQIVAFPNSGAYAGGQALAAYTTTTQQTYIGAKETAGFESFSFDLRYYVGQEMGVGGWFDSDNDGLFDQSEAQFMGGTVVIGGATVFGIRGASFAGTGGPSNNGRYSSGFTGVAGNWYRITVSPDFATLGVLLSIFDLTTETSVATDVSVNLSAAHFGANPALYDGVAVRSTGSTASPTALDNLTLIPEPSTTLLLGLAGLGLLRRRRA